MIDIVDKILISGFGDFVARNKRARRGRNPRTGVDIEITPRRTLRFKSSEELKDSLNRPGNQKSLSPNTPTVNFSR